MGFQGKGSRAGGVALGIVVLLLSGLRPVQAIDCQKAASIAEHTICQDTSIHALDEELTQALHQVLKGHPKERGDILVDERHWIASRDWSCRSFDNDAVRMHSCLEGAYQARLSAVRRIDSEIADGSRVAACTGLLERYRPVANRYPGKPPLRALVQAGAEGVKLAGAGETIQHPPSGLVSWANAQRPPLAVSTQLSDSFAGDDTGGFLIRAPGVPFFTLSRSEGSASCDSSVFFLVKDGVALLARAPFDEDEGGCGTGGEFVSLGSTPLYVRQNYDYAPGMKASLDVATWQSDHFEAACSVSLSYLPRVSAETLNTPENSCSGADCDELRKAAFELVRAKVGGGPSAEELLRGLTVQQRERYQAELTVAKDQSDSDTLSVPPVPYVRQGEVYVVRIADRTIGWRDFADQSVKFERLEDGKITVKATFSVGVWKGDLTGAGVKPIY